MEWIKIEEQVPEIGKHVLIYEEGLFSVSYWDGNYIGKDKNFPCFPDGQDEQPGNYYPTHWMELPEAPI